MCICIYMYIYTHSEKEKKGQSYSVWIQIWVTDIKDPASGHTDTLWTYLHSQFT